MIKDIMRTVIVLSVIALISGGLLGIVNSFTQIDESAALARKIDSTGIYTGEDDLIKLSLSDGGLSQGYPEGELRNVFKGGAQYIIHAAGMGGYGGAVELLVNIENNAIKKIIKYAAEETPGLGTKAFEDSYLTQFYNKDLAKVQAFVRVTTTPADAHEIDAVSGATKSSGAVINAVNVAVTWYLSNVAASDGTVGSANPREIYLDAINGSGNAQTTSLSPAFGADGSGNAQTTSLNAALGADGSGNAQTTSLSPAFGADGSANTNDIYLNVRFNAAAQRGGYFAEVGR